MVDFYVPKIEEFHIGFEYSLFEGEIKNINELNRILKQTFLC